MPGVDLNAVKEFIGGIEISFQDINNAIITKVRQLESPVLNDDPAWVETIKDQLNLLNYLSDFILSEKLGITNVLPTYLKPSSALPGFNNLIDEVKALNSHPIEYGAKIISNKLQIVDVKINNEIQKAIILNTSKGLKKAEIPIINKKDSEEKVLHRTTDLFMMQGIKETLIDMYRENLELPKEKRDPKIKAKMANIARVTYEKFMSTPEMPILSNTQIGLLISQIEKKFTTDKWLPKLLSTGNIDKAAKAMLMINKILDNSNTLPNTVSEEQKKSSGYIKAVKAYEEDVIKEAIKLKMTALPDWLLDPGNNAKFQIKVINELPKQGGRQKIIRDFLEPLAEQYKVTINGPEMHRIINTIKSHLNIEEYKKRTTQ